MNLHGTTVVNVRDPQAQALIQKARAAGMYEYIGRSPSFGGPSEWANPYSHIPSRYTLAEFQVKTKEESLQLYEARLRKDPLLVEKLKALRNKVLGCHCKPYGCHGDIIIKLMKEFGIT
jgi:hypothetical protein